MRQIVQLTKPIVHPKNLPRVQEISRPDQAAQQGIVGLTGKADAYLWDGEDKTIEWQLWEGFGYMLVTAGGLAATCATGKQTQLRQGDLLIMNEANSRSFTMALAGGTNPIGAANTTKVARSAAEVIYGSMRANTSANGGVGQNGGVTQWRAQPFTHAPTWAMAVLQPSESECARLISLAQLLHSETSADENATRVIAGLQATLFEALSLTLRAYDPLSMPQLTAGMDAHLSRALTAMAIAPGKAWRVETMAREAAMSRTAFAVRFKSVMHKTPLDYLTSLRIQHAVTQFANHPNRTIDAVARDVGYADESALRRAYLRVTGEALKLR